MRWPVLIAALACSAAVAGAPPGQEQRATEVPLPLTIPMCRSGLTTAPQRPTLLAGYGTGGFPIRTSVPMAQRFFDNGMQLAFAFEHGAAAAAMREAVRLDPNCAACLWGEAWASGPTINFPIGADRAAELAQLVERARKLAQGAPEKEQALIEALALRYPAGAGRYKGAQVDLANRAFAEAMDALARRWPGDDAIVVLAADAWMIATSWSSRDKTLDRAIELLETVLKRRPADTGAIHFYIHATEWRGEARRAEAFADRLGGLAPAASHLVHMPSHTYIRIGRYRDAMIANVRAVEVGGVEAPKLGMKDADDLMDWGYHAHNVHFGVGAALISGDAKEALALSRPLLARVAAGKSPPRGYTQIIAGTAYFAQGRFADPGSVLAMPAPPKQYAFLTGYWHYARGEAAARLGDAKAVRAEAKAMRIPKGDARDYGTATAVQVLRIARLVLQGRASMLEGRPSAALGAFRRAAKLQEADEFAAEFDPPAFWYPVRRDAAAALLAMGKGQEAMAEADAALRLFPKDPESERIRGRLLARAG